jgi:TatD DNase family protein
MRFAVLAMIDTHAHLNEIDPIDPAIQRAKQNSITGIVAVGMDLESNRVTLDLADRFPGFVYPAIGFHPWSIQADNIEANLSAIEDNLAACIALGEVGLDYKAKVKKPVQWEVFSRLLTMAKKYNRPVIIHSRFSHQRSHQMVADGGIEKAVFHWYSGPLEILKEIIDNGYYVSATPALVYSPPHQAAIEAAPIERILVETDSPVEYRGRVVEPADLAITLKELSRIKRMPAAVVTRITTSNAERFFDLRPV